MEDLTLTGLNGSAKTVDASAIEALGQTLRGELIRPGDDGYDDARQIWNGFHDTRPGLIVRCSGTADVIDMVNFVRDNELLVSIRGGGHNVAGTALCNGGVVIDLSRLKEVRVDPNARTASVGPGAVLGDLDRETQAFGLVAPAGVVSTTGVAGLTLGGGMGWLRRKHGLAIDNLLYVDIVTADGQLRRASDDENQDLFWAIRGGGGNFGVVTNFCFQLHPVGPMVYLGAPVYSMDDAEMIVRKWRDFCNTLSDDVSCFCIYQTIPPSPPFPEHLWNKQAVVLPAMYAGNMEDGEKVLMPLRQFAEPAFDLSGPIPFRALQGGFDWLFPHGNRYYWKTATLTELTDEAIDLMAELGRTRPSPGSAFAIWQMGGAMGRVAADATGYGPRDPWTVALDSGWTDPAEDDVHIGFGRQAHERVRALAGAGMYVHYGALEKEDHIRAAYGENYARLVSIKTMYDPMNLFRVNQNIPPMVPVKESAKSKV